MPQSIRVMVPEEYGACYEGQWVERGIRVKREHYKAIRDVQEREESYLRDDEALTELSLVLASVYTDWNLEGDEGPLPKPWGDPKAFEALASSDLSLFLWLVGKSLAPVASLAEPPKN